MLDRNISPRQVSFMIALTLAVPVAVLAAFSFIWWQALVIFLAFVAGSYFLVGFFVERFINRKIKLIFKFIYDTKAGRREEMYFKYILPKKSLEEVSGEVQNWAVRKNEELEILRSNETYRKEFLQNLSHEFRTPVFSIQGYVEALMDGAREDPDLAAKFLKRAHENILRISHLLGDLDEISQLEQNTNVPAPEHYVIRDQVRDVFDELSMQAAEKNIRCEIKKGSDIPVSVYADRNKIGRVLSNLVQNAIRYGKYGGYILAGIYKTDGGHVLVEISDNGMGIDEASLPRIFERFFRTEAARTRESGGSGLGLSICKHIIEAHGHTIHARSTPGVGTTIGFTLPAGKAGVQGGK